MKRKWLFGTNWKMSKNAREAAEYAVILRERLLRMKLEETVQVFVLPPFTSIGIVKEMSGGAFWVGAQNMHWEESGPFTGEISASMLAELGIVLAQVGHAERREMFYETDAMINKKVLAALRAGFRPLVCIGESAMDRDFKVARETCARQLRIALNNVPEDDVEQIIIAYEPAWAIGMHGSIAAPSFVRDMKFHFGAILADMFGANRSQQIPTLYGGSVSSDGATEMLLDSHMDGLFVGRSALDSMVFANLIESCVSAAASRS
jgi:triosephosphate isomerase